LSECAGSSFWAFKAKDAAGVQADDHWIENLLIAAKRTPQITEPSQRQRWDDQVYSVRWSYLSACVDGISPRARYGRPDEAWFAKLNEVDEAAHRDYVAMGGQVSDAWRRRFERRRMNPFSDRGRKPNWRAYAATTALLRLFVTMFNETPSCTENGPTVRFVRVFFDALQGEWLSDTAAHILIRRALEQAPPGTLSSASHELDCFSVPTIAASRPRDLVRTVTRLGDLNTYDHHWDEGQPWYGHCFYRPLERGGNVGVKPALSLFEADRT
jgi:hypothetical protein